MKNNPKKRTALVFIIGAVLFLLYEVKNINGKALQRNDYIILSCTIVIISIGILSYVTASRKK